MRIIYAGTPEFAAEGLRALLAAGHDIALVLTQPDRPAGRGMKLQPSAVKALALQHGIAVAQPRSLRLDGKYPDDAVAARAALRAAARLPEHPWLGAAALARRGADSPCHRGG